MCSRYRFVCILWRACVARHIFWEVLAINIDNLPINEAIRAPEVRVVDENGGQLGIMSSKQALAIAEERELDLVMIAPQGVPPVCRIMDYGKYRFEASKREKESRKKQKVITVKEIQLSYTIEERDLEIKAKNAIRILKDGDNVRVSIRFRGRQIAHAKLGEQVMLRFAEMIKPAGKVDRLPVLEGRSMQMYVSAATIKETKEKKIEPKKESDSQEPKTQE